MATTKRQLTRDDFTDEQWAAVGRVFDFVRRMKLKKRAACALGLSAVKELPK